ncbi:hypothetical protein FNV43_RR12988 [Rhamnella rubrinervis]|uniref:Uncharacterized protein n=1 Tax=Rhamnella rubrinervis TaxID=2594499 RepID=A0A8K0H097_9ROSA|nr:hypothetical protein FNV43_RR12988 [Rhamnella rubrinervis]
MDISPQHRLLGIRGELHRGDKGFLEELPQKAKERHPEPIVKGVCRCNLEDSPARPGQPKEGHRVGDGNLMAKGVGFDMGLLRPNHDTKIGLPSEYKLL